MKNIALFGGSFNPPHPGHFEMARHIYKSLEVDEVWFLFSQNPFKDPLAYESVNRRIELSRIQAQHYPELPFIACDIEEDVKSNRTYEILCALREMYTISKFIWVMGADNLAQFHTWANHEKIIEEFTIAVVDRPGYTEAAENSETSLKYEFIKQSDPKMLKYFESGWSFIKNNEMIDLSSSGLLAALRSGQTKFSDNFQIVADSILKNRLYGTGLQTNPALNAPAPKL